MSKSELKAAIEDRLGLKLVPVGEKQCSGHAEYHVVSPTGVRMFMLGIYHAEHGWEVGSTGSVCQEIWRIGR